MSTKKHKIVLIGDLGSGKTCFALTYNEKKFPSDYIPAVLDAFTEEQIFNKKEHEFLIVDSLGKTELDRNRWENYHNADIFFLCFSVVDPVSYENVTSKWIEEIQSHEEDPKYLLVGMKTDLRANETIINSLRQQLLQPITPEQGMEKAREIEALDYMECSALMGAGVQDAFDAGIRFILEPPQEGGCCTIF
ncbi:ras-related C3 botulinum toxin substrate 3 [Histomonas meleagridis]|uniref:ras-related C3 botulinum toxin substrate 3 n=1 Tax=Histomonas meleagridis TaxID=135588 RepID=UPI00355A9D8C|nr:ras-related C3 botulinum toxin substrate 3 [Histomonas meleagridis]KAH0806999.1 ras-related C3 botulinum toxin substrate 3 [Histomonas meleagridis]